MLEKPFKHLLGVPVFGLLSGVALQDHGKHLNPPRLGRGRFPADQGQAAARHNGPGSSQPDRVHCLSGPLAGTLLSGVPPLALPSWPRCLPGGRACRGVCRRLSSGYERWERVGMGATHPCERLRCILSASNVETGSPHRKNHPQLRKRRSLKNKRGKRWKLACDAQAKRGKP